MTIEQKLAGYKRLAALAVIVAFASGILTGFALNINTYMAGIPACL